MRLSRLTVLTLALSCTDKTTTDVIIPPTGTETDTDTDTDADTDADTDTDTDTDPGPTALCEPLDAPVGATAVAPSDDLQAAVYAAADGATLSLADGTYKLIAPVVIDKPIRIVSASLDASSVTIDGDYLADDLFRVQASDVTLAHLTLTQSFDALVSIEATSADVLNTKLHALNLVDPGRVAVTNWDGGAEVYDAFHADDGEVSCTTIELTNAGRDEVRGVCDVSGIELLGARGWMVRDNHLEGLFCQTGWADPAIMVTRGSRDTVITRNQLVDVSYGIVLGLTADVVGRVYEDAPCGPGVFQHIDGWVTNNLVSAYDEDLFFVDAGELTEGVLTGIRTESSCNGMILHNSVYSTLAPFSASLEQKYDTTTGIIANNLLSFEAVRYVDADADVFGNLEFVPIDTWFWPSMGDFHTSDGATEVIDQGDPITLGMLHVDVDVDGQPRADGAPDVGADEKP